MTFSYYWTCKNEHIATKYVINKLSLGQYGKNKSNTNIFRIDPIPVSPITARSEPARRFNDRKEKSRKILDWLINKGIITWCFSYWPSYRSSVLLYWTSAAPQANTAGLGPMTRQIWNTSRNNTIIFINSNKLLCSYVGDVVRQYDMINNNHASSQVNSGRRNYFNSITERRLSSVIAIRVNYFIWWYIGRTICLDIRHWCIVIL